MSSEWLEVTVRSEQGTAEQLEGWLFEAGALSVTLRDSHEDDGDLSHAVLEPVPGEVRLWEQVTLVGLFARDMHPEELRNALHLSAAIHELALPSYQLDALADREWARTWMDTFKPMQFGERFWICPTEHSPPDSDAINLRLDPGLAFGTGTHATTAQCLSWLGEQTSRSLEPLKGRTVIDYGCGSGVLAIAALLLGASKAWAVDIDEQALLATRENARQNGVSERLLVGQPVLVESVEADIVLANILFKPLMALADTMALAVKPGGALIMSGILEDQMDALRLRYNNDFEFALGQATDGWALMTATRR